MILYCIVTTQHLDTDTVFLLYRTSLQNSLLHFISIAISIGNIIFKILILYHIGILFYWWITLV